MNKTLNNLALLSFQRKVRKINKKIVVDSYMDGDVPLRYFMIRKGETLILWSEENGFHSIFQEGDIALTYLVSFPDKYTYDEIYYFGVLNSEKTILSLYRCYEQFQHKGETLIYGLQFKVEEDRDKERLELNEESELPFLQTGNMSRL